MASLALYIFFTFSHKRHNFLGKLLNIKGFFLFSLQVWYETFLILRRILRDITTNVHKSSCNLSAIFCQISSKHNFFYIFSKNTQIPNFMEIRPVEAEMFHAARETAMAQLIVPYGNFAEAPKHVIVGLSSLLTKGPTKTIIYLKLNNSVLYVIGCQ